MPVSMAAYLSSPSTTKKPNDAAVAAACEGFDRYSGKLWIYPNNMAIRGYQKEAVRKALFTNAMIVLPTGFGKTFIAAVVMYNFYRWYPQGKIIFVAPTRPLVAQQIQECKKISGIPSSDCFELTGHTPREKRIVHWEAKRVFFATPQVIQNDLESYILPASQVKCLVIDEAHRAQGGYAYVEIVKQLHQLNPNGFRILALSATPGSDIQRVQQVMLNLFIGDVMFRSEHSIDLMQFKNEKISKAWTVELRGKHREIVDKFIDMTDDIFKCLYRAGLTYSGDSIDKVAHYVLIKGLDSIKNNDVGRGVSKGKLSFYCSTAISLSHAFELLTLYGIRVFYSHVTKNLVQPRSAIKTAMAGKVSFDVMMNDIRSMFGDDIELDPNKASKHDLLKGHPKLQVVKDLLMKHFTSNEQNTETRAIVFTKYRESVYDIVQTMRAFEPVLKPVAFVGQGSAGRTGAGMRQKDQIQVVKDFRDGKFNVLVATCVAEEGLDIGEVDLIICYDTTSSPISNTQRRGRTGRKRSGDVQTLLTKGFEEKKLKKAGASKRQVEEQLFKRENYMTHRYREAPRMIPADIEPVCLEQKIYPINDEPEIVKEPKRKRLKKQATEEVEVVMVKKKGCKEGLEEDWDEAAEEEDEELETSMSLALTASASSGSQEPKEQEHVEDEEEWEDWDAEMPGLMKAVDQVQNGCH